MAFSYIPATIKNRLLRFVLARIDLIDHEALDLESLDFSIGKQSTIELRDAGLLVDKVAALLSLPRALELKSAKIAVIRITIPADLHCRGITVEIIRPHIVLQLTSNQQEGASSPPSDERIPTTQDLAQSFLEEAEEAEVQELENAFEEEVVGTGVGLPLPVFIMNFLNGIRDRLQVVIIDVLFELETGISFEDSHTRDDGSGLEYSIRLSIGSLEVDGVTTVSAPQGQDTGHTLPTNVGGRKIVFKEVNAFLDINIPPIGPDSVPWYQSEDIGLESYGQPPKTEERNIPPYCTDTPQVPTNTTDPDLARIAHLPSENTSASGFDDLSESKLFTHEEAASMYFSATSDLSGGFGILTEPEGRKAARRISQVGLVGSAGFNHRCRTTSNFLGVDEVVIWAPSPSIREREAEPGKQDLETRSAAGSDQHCLPVPRTTSEPNTQPKPGSFHGDMPPGQVVVSVNGVGSFKAETWAGKLLWKIAQNFCNQFTRTTSETVTETSSSGNSISRLTFSAPRFNMTWYNDGDLCSPLLNLVFEDIHASIEAYHGVVSLSISVGDLFLTTSVNHPGDNTEGILLGLRGETLASEAGAPEHMGGKGGESKPALSFHYKQQPNTILLHLDAQPLHITLDLFLLDEIFVPFGGLSGLLEMSSSITSSRSSPEQVSQPRSKVVRFSDAPVSDLPKIKVSVADGSWLKLKGRHCTLFLLAAPINILGPSEEKVLNQYRIDCSSLKVSGRLGVQAGSQLVHDAFQATLSDCVFSYLQQPESSDLETLIELVSPSNDKFGTDDDLVLPTLIKQRKQGAICRIRVDELTFATPCFGTLHSYFRKFTAELAKLSGVAKYLPDNDRPSVLTVASIHTVLVRLPLRLSSADRAAPDPLQPSTLRAENARLAHVGTPQLFTVEISGIYGDYPSLTEQRRLIGSVTAKPEFPMIKLRMIDEFEPTVKIKLYNFCMAYHADIIRDLMKIAEDPGPEDTPQQFPSDPIVALQLCKSDSPPSENSEDSSPPSKSFHIDILLRDCAIELNPAVHGEQPNPLAMIVLTSSHVKASLLGKDVSRFEFLLDDASLLLIDDSRRINRSGLGRTNATEHPVRSNDNLLKTLRRIGLVNLGTVSKAQAVATVSAQGEEKSRCIEIDVNAKLILLETCADSTATLVALGTRLLPPTLQSKQPRYRTEIIAMEDLLEGLEEQSQTPLTEGCEEKLLDHLTERSIESMTESSLFPPSPSIAGRIGNSLLNSFEEENYAATGNFELDLGNSYFTSLPQNDGVAHKWDSRNGTYGLENAFNNEGNLLKLRVRDVNLIWNLHDGYDWPDTRQHIVESLRKIEAKHEERRKAEERRKTKRDYNGDDDDFEYEDDLLFNSVYIHWPVNTSSKGVIQGINKQLGHVASDTASIAPSVISQTTQPGSKLSWSQPKDPSLNLRRSKSRRMTFDLQKISADIANFPPDSGETQSSINLRVRDFEIFDHIPESTWHKFVTYNHCAGTREMGRDMVNLEILTVKPVPELAVSEYVIKVTVLPLRLHVDQRALDYTTRFFQFQDSRIKPPKEMAEMPFFQRVEVNQVDIVLDYKPYKVDYPALSAGRQTEFMNFVTLDTAPVTLRHVICLGVHGPDRLHTVLNDVWMPDVKSSQLAGILSSLAPVRSLANIGSGVRNLIEIPLKQYQRDGRIFYGVKQGAAAFAKQTATELVKLGAKVAIGAQTFLENAEESLSPSSAVTSIHRDGPAWENLSESVIYEPEPRRVISNYADQPIGVVAGLRSAIRGLQRDLGITYDAVIAIPGEIAEEGSGKGVVKAVAKRAPTLVLRPIIGASKAMGAAFLGVTNALDKESKQRIQDKWKKH